jgi:hypothetical protein
MEKEIMCEDADLIQQQMFEQEVFDLEEQQDGFMNDQAVYSDEDEGDWDAYQPATHPAEQEMPEQP